MHPESRTHARAAPGSCCARTNAPAARHAPGPASTPGLSAAQTRIRPRVPSRLAARSAPGPKERTSPGAGGSAQCPADSLGPATTTAHHAHAHTEHTRTRGARRSHEPRPAPSSPNRGVAGAPLRGSRPPPGPGKMATGRRATAPARPPPRTLPEPAGAGRRSRSLSPRPQAAPGPRQDMATR